MKGDEATATASFRSVLKATSVVGGASAINILIGMLRTKVVALLLGPAGVGLLTTFTQITTVVATLSGFGIGNSGVRQVAQAFAGEDEKQIAITVVTLRWMALVTGIVGLAVMAAFCVPISRVTFGSSEYAPQIAFLGISLLFASVASGQTALLRGARRIADFASVTVGGAVCSTLISIPCYYLWGTRGIVVSLILSALAALMTSWFYAKRVPVQPVPVSWRECCEEARALLTLGGSFMGAAVASTGTAYVIQALLIREFSLSEAGMYQAAYTLSGVLVGFVLGAMGADYYPRLTAASGDNFAVREMANEQTLISILLALPCLGAMMVFAPLVLELFYTDAFAAATSLLRWCVLGILGRVISWPLGFVILAKGEAKLFLITETVDCAVHIAGVFFFTRMWGMDGAGIAFLLLYIFHTLLMLEIVRRLVGGAWNRQATAVAGLAVASMGGLMINCTFNRNLLLAWGVNLVLLGGLSWICLKQLTGRSGVELHALLVKLRIKR